MAISIRRVLIPVFIYSIFLLCHSVKCDEEDSLFRSINDYRATLNLTALTKNKNAECMADEISEEFQRQPCTNTSGPNAIPGTDPDFATYPAILTKCRLNVSNTRDGQILPACVPNLEATLVVSNFTRSQYTKYLNDTKFTGIGIGHEDNWIVVVLTTSTPEGSYVPAMNTIDDDNDDNDHDDHKDDDDHDDHKDDRHDRRDDHDEEDILLQGINAHRATSNIPALVKSEAADCFADEFADRFQDQPCSNTTGSITAPATITNISGYPDLVFKCGLNVPDGIVLPACALNSAPNVVLTSLKSSPFSASLGDPKFTGVGVGSEDDWLVVVLTSGTPVTGPVVPGGTTPNRPNPFNKVNSVDGVDVINKASFVPKVGLSHCFLVLLVAFVFLT